MLALAAFGAACDGDNGDAKGTATPTAQRATETERTSAPLQSPVATPSPSPTASPTVRPRGDERLAAVAAAVAAMDGRSLPTLIRDACLEGNPASKACVALTSDEETVRGGVAVFAGGYPDAGLFTLAMGRMRDGAWAVWFITQQPSYLLTDLPGEALACGEGKLPLRAEAGASATVVGEVERLTRLGAQEFVLGAPGSVGDGARGEGWYRIGSPVAAWVAARDTTAAERGTCDLRDAVESGTPRG